MNLKKYMPDFLLTGLVLLLAAIPSCAMVSAVGSQGPATPENTSLFLEFERSLCSATAVGPHTLLTATHCTVKGSLKAINDQPVKVYAITHDGNDHTLLVVDREFDHYAPLRQIRLGLTEEIRYVGNPNGFRTAYRDGYVLGHCRVPDECLSDLVGTVPYVSLKDDVVTLFDVHGWGGDSGAGVFDVDGNVVTTVSITLRIAPTMMAMGGFDMQFTKEQLEGIR